MKSTIIIAVCLYLLALALYYSSSDEELTEQQKYVHYIWQN